MNKARDLPPALSRTAQLPRSAARILRASWGQIVSALCALIGIRLYTELMPAPAFGAAMLLMGLVALLDGICTMALSQVLLTFCAEAQGRAAQREVAVRLVRAMIPLFLWIALPFCALTLLGTGLGLPALAATAVLLLVLYLLSEMLKAGILAPMLARADYAGYSFWLAVDAVISVLATLSALWFFHPTAASYLLGFVTGKILTMLLLQASTERGRYYWTVSGRISPAEALRYGAPIAAMGPLGWVASYFDRYVLSSVAGAASGGLYVASTSVVTRPYALLTAMLTNYFRPQLPAHRSGGSAERLRVQGQWLFAAGLAGLAGATLFVVLGPMIAAVLLAPSYRANAALLMGAIGLAQTFAIMTHALDNTMLSMRQSGSLLRLQTGLVLVTTALIPVFTLWLGLPGAALGRVAAEAIKFALTYHLVTQFGGRRSTRLVTS